MRKLLNRLKNLAKDRGFVISFFLSIVVLIVFFSNLLFHANSVFFGTTGDGIQVYYTSLFHVLHDKSYLYQEAMNYPFRESVFFTACQPLITDFIRLFGLDYFTIGILNLTMLLSLPISVWFLYFIFKEFEVNYLVAAIGALAIGYFTPQVYRMGAHYTLAYSFAIPAIIYLMIRFYKAPSLKKSIWISVLVFFMASTHMYFFLFYGLIIAAVWGVFFYAHKFRESFLLFIKHFSIQVVIPLFLLQFIIFILNDVNDRTNHPWGFFEYMSNWSGIFYPYGRYYEYLFKNNNLESIPVSEEGIAFVGLCATFLTLIFILKIVRNILNFDIKTIFRFTNSLVLNGLIVCSFISLFYSFCWPFIFGYQDLVYKLGFLQQMRALGRFAWIFFYIINIALIVVIANLKEKYNKFYFKTVLISFVLFMLSYDAYINIANCNNTFNNKIVELKDSENLLEENQWLNQINIDEFQAILPFPYFHVGSENASVEPKPNFPQYPYIVSLKTGLPIIAVLSSRISLSQTYRNLALIKEPNGKIPDILNEFKNQKDILIVTRKDLVESTPEKNIISLSEIIVETPKFTLNRLKYAKLVEYFKGYYTYKKNELLKKTLFLKDNYYSTDSLNRFIVKNSEMDNDDIGFASKGSLTRKASEYFTIFNDSLAISPTDSNFVFSFWINSFKTDLYPRGTIAIDEYMAGQEKNLVFASLKDFFKQMNGDWALIECSIKLRRPNNRVKIVIWHTELKNDELYEVDDVLLRPINTDVYRDFGKYMLINNYIYNHD